jgi:hypothetical protein
MTEAGITVSWSMKPADWLDIAAIVERSGAEAMVRFALDTKATTRQPVRYATFFLRGGWRGLPPKSNGPRESPSRDPRAAWPEWCKDPDCDEITRTRQIENDNGIRSLIRCQQCHPNRKEPAA